MGKRIGVLILALVLAGFGVTFGSFLGRSEVDTPAPRASGPGPESGGRIKVEVLNASGVSGIARDATGCLRDQGFDVVYYGNAGTYGEDPSVVIDRAGDSVAARSVGEALGIVRIRSEPDPSLLVDVTVLLGPEWSAPEGVPEEEEDSPPWWDLRRFIRRDEPPETVES